MAEQLLDKARDVVEGSIDFDGQRKAENYQTIFLSLTGIVAFIAGYALEDIRLCMQLGLSGTLLTFLVVVPSWPFYNTNPVKWLPIGSSFKTRGG